MRQDEGAVMTPQVLRVCEKIGPLAKLRTRGTQRREIRLVCGAIKPFTGWVGGKYFCISHSFLSPPTRALTTRGYPTNSVQKRQQSKPC